MASGHILQSLASLANSPPQQPQANIPVLGLRGHSACQGPLAPLAISKAFGTPSLIEGSMSYTAFLGHIGPLWPALCGTLQSPFWPKSNEDKRGQRGIPLPPRPGGSQITSGPT
ncbi:hypothetical protein O181_003620 [Austropuccinia psidii MF-1]|uniref:Uncharacterized protein n=1 Tax=Austropuccinia psidii MF-1 TaxID=1389203 RepID=A0A9Q3BFC8_9BASI|nr:hypothetical protein [Austropuccinia psidii MF-1]